MHKKMNKKIYIYGLVIGGVVLATTSLFAAPKPKWTAAECEDAYQTRIRQYGVCWGSCNGLVGRYPDQPCYDRCLLSAMDKKNRCLAE